jgi:hypothetical protein
VSESRRPRRSLACQSTTNPLRILDLANVLGWHARYDCIWWHITNYNAASCNYAPGPYSYAAQDGYACSDPSAIPDDDWLGHAAASSSTTASNFMGVGYQPHERANCHAAAYGGTGAKVSVPIDERVVANLHWPLELAVAKDGYAFAEIDSAVNHPNLRTSPERRTVRNVKRRQFSAYRVG